MTPNVPAEGQRHRHPRDERRPEPAQKQEHHHDDQGDADEERQLHVVDRRADRLSAVADDGELDRRRQPAAQLRQDFANLIGNLDDVRRGLLAHEQQHGAVRARSSPPCEVDSPARR